MFNGIVFKQQLISNLLTIRTGLLLLVTLLIGGAAESFGGGLGAVAFLYLLFGLPMTSGSIAGEVETQSIRYVLPLVDRTTYYLSKLAATVVYWLALVLLAGISGFIVGGATVGQVNWLSAIVVPFYVISVGMLVSVVFNRERQAFYFAITVVILLLIGPQLSGISFFLVRYIGIGLNYLTPLNYMNDSISLLVPFVLTIVATIAGVVIFKRKAV